MGHYISRRVSGPAHTYVAVVSGVVDGLFTFGLALAIAAAGAIVLTSWAGRGSMGLEAFIPSSMVSATHGTRLQVEGTAEQQMAVEQAYDDIGWPVDPSGFVVVVTGPRNLPPNASGSYLFPDNVICLNSDVVNDGCRQQLDQVLAHEVGHMFDCMYLDASARAEYLSLRGFPAGTDWRSEASEWAQRPNEDFAEVYAAFAAPSSGVPIATDAGRTNNPGQIEALIARCQPRDERPSRSRAGTSLSLPLSLAP